MIAASWASIASDLDPAAPRVVAEATSMARLIALSGWVALPRERHLPGRAAGRAQAASGLSAGKSTSVPSTSLR